MADVKRNPEENRFEVWVDGEMAGQLDYEAGDGVWVLPHTEVAKAFEGRGLAGELVRAALDEARAEGVTIVPECPYVAGWIARHPEYQDLVA